MNSSQNGYDCVAGSDIVSYAEVPTTYFGPKAIQKRLF